jgi:hypothetical protein
MPHVPTRIATLASLAAVLALGTIPVAALTPAPAAAQVQATPAPGSGAGGGTSLEQAAQRAGDTGRAVARDLLVVAFAVAAVILVFRRDFKEAAVIFAIGLLAVLLASPAGLNALNDLVATLFGQ